MIEEKTDLIINKTIFDSDLDDWFFESSQFANKLMDKNRIMILIEDTKGNLFGCYINEMIKKAGVYINDPNAFIFSLRLIDKNEIKIYPIKDSSKAFVVYSRENHKLFSCGEGKDGKNDDLTIMKSNKQYEEPRNGSTPHSYDFGKKTKGLFDGNHFIVKRIMIYQMDESSERKNQKLRQITEKTIRTKRKEIQQLEEWSETIFKEVIFDSEINSWGRYHSDFDSIVFGKDKLIFLIEDEEGNVFGGYINSKM